MGYFGDNGRKLGVDIVQVEYIRLELIEQSGELCPDFTGAEWAAQRLDYSQPGGEFNLARKLLQYIYYLIQYLLDKGLGV